VRVAIDHRLCDGCGLCARYAPGAFLQLADGLAYPVGHGPLPDAPPPGVLSGEVPDLHRADVLDAIDECPEACLAVDDAADPAVELTEDPVVAGGLVDLVRHRYRGPAYDSVTRVGETDADVHVWTSSGSYHRVRRSA
jgi:ferredoxin